MKPSQHICKLPLLSGFISVALLAASPMLSASGFSFGIQVPNGAIAGDLTLTPCSIYLEGDKQEYPGDCGTLVVKENRSNPNSRLIALPVSRVTSLSKTPMEPLFWFEGGPGASNQTLYPTDGLLESHALVMVGYRGIDGQVRPKCPEIQNTFRNQSGDYFSRAALQKYSKSAKACGDRLINEELDFDGYSINQTIDDMEDARRALGYEKINLFGNSYGTRVQMLYQWRYPQSINRVALIAANPPGHFVFDPQVMQSQIEQYASLCAADVYCSSRTTDLIASMQSVIDNAPKKWMGAKLDLDMLRFFTNISFHESMQIEGELPINGPAIIDLWLDAAEGNYAGLALLSLLGPTIMPEAFQWGHFLTVGGSVPDFNDPNRDYISELQVGDTLIGSNLSLMIAGLMQGFPAIQDQALGVIPDSDIETLVVGGTIDFSTPMEYARDELMPHLSKGQHVIISGQAHTETFWHSQPEARARLLTSFFATGTGDASLFVEQKVIFDAPSTWDGFAKKIFAAAVFVLVSLLVILWWVVSRFRRNKNKPAII